ncbi:Phosphoenolpyruvate carboxylase [Talaromyces islandicus]|uniref:Phosphoenolpyruvate carboxylase n=1 Tax=Talaromyces islandicus TaxID=28573 RepID=A0A0U1MB53_TALIS|nr:Phosphoenolpyruvate carboxylase [Talaromyces islandicus]
MADDNIRVFLKEFEKVVRKNGKVVLAERIRQIRRLPEPLNYLCKILSENHRSRRQDASFEQRFTWFKNYTSEKGKKLCKSEAKDLASLTRKWNLEESVVHTLHISVSLWTKFPFLFWDGEQPHDDIIRRSFDDLQRMVNIDPIKRKVLLATLSSHVEERQREVFPNAEWEDTSLSDSQWRRPSCFLESSLIELTKQLWPDITGPEERKKRTWLANFSRWGWKWMRLENPGMVLSLSSISSSCFEKKKLNGLQFKALNSWVTTTSQFNIIDTLNTGWDAIVNYYCDIRRRRWLAEQYMVYGPCGLLQPGPGNSPRPHNQQAVCPSSPSPDRPPFLAADSDLRSESSGELSDYSSAESSVDVEEDEELPSPKRQCLGRYNVRRVPSQACVGRSYPSSSTSFIENLQSSRELLPGTSEPREEAEEHVISSCALEGIQAASLLSTQFSNSGVNLHLNGILPKDLQHQPYEISLNDHWPTQFSTIMEPQKTTPGDDNIVQALPATNIYQRVPTAQSHDAIIVDFYESPSSQMPAALRTELLPSPESNISQDCLLPILISQQAPPLRHRNDDVQEFFSGCSRVLCSPSPPTALSVSESLFRLIKVYFENSCQHMIFDEDENLLNPSGIKLNYDPCNDFDSYCFTATMLVGRKLHFRHALSKAFDLVKPILQAEHPQTLPCFLEVFIHLIQTGLLDVATSLRRFIKSMSAEIIRDGRPWGQICRLLGELDSDTLDEALARIWKCTTDTFESKLGAYSRLAVSVRLDYIKRVFGITSKFEEEFLLRDLLGKFNGILSLSTPRVMLNLAHNLNRQGRHGEAEEMALKVLSLLQENEIYSERIVERIECLKIVSHSQFYQCNLAAEQTMREAIQIIVDQWGIQHPWFLEFMNVLESWLRHWDRKEDANKLLGEIEVLRRKDEIDEQLDGVGSPCEDDIGEA